MKKALLGLLGVVLVVAGLLVIVPSFIDARTMLGPAIEAVKTNTGRELKVGGVSLSLLPTPGASLTDVSLSNIPGAQNPDMVRVKSIEVRVALWPLLARQVQVESIALVDPALDLETTKDGRHSWDFPPQQSDGAFDVSLDSLTVRNGAVVLRDAGAGSIQRIEAIDLVASARSLSGPFKAKGGAKLAGVPVSFDAGVDRIDPGNTAHLRLALDAAGAKATFGGTLLAPKSGQPMSQAQVSGKIAMTAASLADVAAKTAAGGAELPAFAAQAFTLDAQVQGTPQRIVAHNVQVALGDMRGTGAFALGLGERTTLQLSLALGRLDLDKLLAQSGPARAPAAPPAKPAAPAKQPAAVSPIPKNLLAAVEVTVEAIVYRGQAIQRAQAKLDVADGALVVKQIAAQLPAGSSVDVTNLRLFGAGQRMPDGRIAARSDNLRGLLEWAGIDVSAVPPQLLRSFALDAAVRSEADTVQISNLEAKLDTSTLTGAVTAVYRERPAYGVRIAIDQINADRYLAAPARAPAAPAKPAPAGSADANPSAQSSTQPPGFAGGGDALKSLDAFDMNLVASIGTLTWRNTPIRGVNLEAQLANGKLTVPKVDVQDLAGATAQARLSAEKLSASPTFSTEFEMKASDAKRLLRFAGFESPVPPESIGALAARGSIAGTPASLKLDTTLQGFGGQGRLVGTVTLGGNAPRMDMALDASVPEFGPLLGAFAGQAAPGAAKQKLGPFTAKGRIANTAADTIAVRDTQIRALGAALDIDGTVSALLSPAPTIDMGVALKMPSLRPLLVAFNPDPALLQAADRLGGIDAKGRAAGNTAKVSLKDAALEGLGGQVRFSGEVFELAGKPRVDIAADIANFNPGPLLAAMPRGTLLAALGKDVGTINGKAQVKGGMEGVSVTLQNLNAQAFGGTLALNGAVSDAMTAKAAANLAFDVKGVNAGKLLAALPMGEANPNLAKGLQALTAKGTIGGTFASPSLKLEALSAQLFGGAVTAAGSVADATGPGMKYDLAMAANLPSLQALLEAFYQPASNVIPGGVQFANLRVVGDAKAVRVENLQGQLGPTAVRGALQVAGLDSPRPKISGNIRIDGAVDIDALSPAQTQRRGETIEPIWRTLFPDLVPASYEGAAGIKLAQLPFPIPGQPQQQQQQQQAPIQPVRISAPPQGGAPHQRWSRQPYKFDALLAYDADVRIDGVTFIRYGRYGLSNLAGNVTLANGALAMRQIAGQIFLGQLAGEILLNAAGNVPRGSVHLTLNRANVYEMMKAVAGNDRVEGWISADARFDFAARNETDIVYTLNGGAALQGEVKARISASERQNMAGMQLLGGLLGSQMQGLSQTLTQMTGDMPGGLMGMMSMAGLLMANDPGRLSGAIDFRNGLMTERDLQVANRELILTTQGWVNLPVYVQDLAIEGYRRPPQGAAPQPPQRPMISVHQRGPLDRPTRNIQTDQAQIGGAAPAGQAPAGQAPAGPLDQIFGRQPAPAPAPGQTAPAPQDPLKGILDLMKPKP